MKGEAHSEKGQVEKDLTGLKSEGNESFENDSNFRLDIQSTLLATKKALDEDMKNLSITNVDAQNIQKLSQLFDLPASQAEAILKSNNNDIEKSIDNLLLRFSEFEKSKLAY
ncbi:hypothetical protein HWI79_275 [Cryptosporidium felis]|nr:hypothetical protein HWI79_275 [Cryptosporidium felis]